MFVGIVYTEKYFIITDGNQSNVVLMAWDAWTWCIYLPLAAIIFEQFYIKYAIVILPGQISECDFQCYMHI